MRAARTDDNQAEVVSALRSIGCTVQPLHTVGKGCPDLLVGAFGSTILMEVKDGAKPPSRRQLTPDELDWHRAWTGGALAVVCDVESAIRAAMVASKGQRHDLA